MNNKMAFTSTSHVVLVAVLLATMTTLQLARAECVMRPPPGPNDDPLNGGYLVPNKTITTATWNITETCDLFKQGDPVCCTQNQYTALSNKLLIMQYKMVGCDACNIIFARLWCEYTCGANQSNYVSIDSYVPGAADHRVSQVTVTVTKSLSKRLWESCANAGMLGLSSFGSLFINGVYGFFGFVSGNSPVTGSLPDGSSVHLFSAIVIDENLDSKGINASSVEQNYPCAHLNYTVKSNTYPMPSTTVGGYSLQFVSMTGFVGVAVLVLILGVWNMWERRSIDNDMTTSIQSQPLKGTE